jgi:16S rRNA G527 N7-methylase RsmG
MSVLLSSIRALRRLAVLTVLSATLLSAGCKTWYKPGSDEEEFAEQERRCEQQSADSSAASVEECLQFSGWSPTEVSVKANDPADTDEFD